MFLRKRRSFNCIIFIAYLWMFVKFNPMAVKSEFEYSDLFSQPIAGSCTSPNMSKHACISIRFPVRFCFIYCIFILVAIRCFWEVLQLPDSILIIISVSSNKGQIEIFQMCCHYQPPARCATVLPCEIHRFR